MVIKIHGNKISTCTQRVLVVCKELNVPVEIVVIDLAKGEHKHPDYVANLQPFGQIPVLEEEDGFKLFESRAICRYIATKYGKGALLPTEPKANALFEQAASIELSNFDTFASPLVFEILFKPFFGLKPDEARGAELQKKLEQNLKVYDTILSKQKYLAGDTITLADLFHLPYGTHVTDSLKIDALTSSKTPNVARWWADLSSRPSWKEALTAF